MSEFNVNHVIDAVWKLTMEVLGEDIEFNEVAKLILDGRFPTLTKKGIENGPLYAMLPDGDTLLYSDWIKSICK